MYKQSDSEHPEDLSSQENYKRVGSDTETHLCYTLTSDTDVTVSSAPYSQHGRCSPVLMGT